MSRVPVILQPLFPCTLRHLILSSTILAAVAGLAAPALLGDHDTYLKAAQQPRMQDRLRELELFASSTETTALKIQALELMAWYYKQLGDEANANLWVKQLLTFDRENPLGLAVLVENARRGNPNSISPDTLSFAQRGLRRAERFEKPEGLPDAEFSQLRQRMMGILQGTIGYSYFQQKDHANARTFLRKAVSAMPDDAQFVYALGLADLEGENPNGTEGYWYLARAVNLTQGTPAGQQIAEYAANRYREEGGSTSAWNQFVASAASVPVTPEAAVAVIARSVEAQPSQPTAASSTTAETQAPAAARAAAPISAATSGAGTTSSPAMQPVSPTTNARAPAQPLTTAPAPSSASTGNVASASSKGPNSARSGTTEVASATVSVASPALPPRGRAAPQPEVNRVPTSTQPPASAPAASVTTPSMPVAPPSSASSTPSAGQAPVEMASVTVPPPPLIQRPPLSPRDPVSLGILIQTAIASDENRSAVNYALVDMLRHLRSNDEAFILSFGQQLEFKQDLTQNYDLLEAAMQAIQPDEGAPLLDAVGFSSGHLARIAKNRNRVLLVISDGRDIGSRSPGHEITGQIDASGVRIYCIGVGVNDAGDRSRLEQLASHTGGRATFISSPLQFRSATRQIAAGLGIEFPM